MKTESYKLIPSPEFQAEIHRIASQYEGFIKVNVSGRLHEIESEDFMTGETSIKPMPSLWINAWYLIKDVEEHITVNAVDAASLTVEFYDKLIEKFEPDFYPVDELNLIQL